MLCGNTPRRSIQILLKHGPKSSHRHGDSPLPASGSGPGVSLYGDPGFENGTNTAPWSMTSGVINNSDRRALHTAAPDGKCQLARRLQRPAHRHATHTTVTIPANITTERLSRSGCTSTRTVTSSRTTDTLLVQIRQLVGDRPDDPGDLHQPEQIVRVRSQKTFDLYRLARARLIQIYLIGDPRPVPVTTSFVLDRLLD